MEYKQKYFKYKAKYLALKNQIGSGNVYLQELIKAYNSPNPGKAVAMIPNNSAYNDDFEALMNKLLSIPKGEAKNVILTEICRVDTKKSSGLCH